MAYSINFLNQHRRSFTKQQQADKRIYFYALSIAGAVVLLTMGVLAGRLFMNQQMTTAQAEETRLKNAILSEEENERKLLVMAAKLQVLSRLIDERHDKQEALVYFSNLFGPQVLIRDITYQASEGVLTLGLQSQSVFVLREVYDLLASVETLDRFEKVTKSSLSRNSSGSYGMNISIGLTSQAEL